MKPFMDRDFLLQTNTARELYHRHAAPQPIIDYHCHLDPAMVNEDHRFRSITELWLGGDHYKWRAMRTNGVPEHLITGDASDWEKFEAWAATVPYTLRNPLYHWTHLELKTAFGINDCLSPQTFYLRPLQRPSAERPRIHGTWTHASLPCGSCMYHG